MSDSQPQRRWQDPIVAEVRKQRQELFAEFKYDLEAYVEDKT